MAVDPANVQAASNAAPNLDPATIMGAAATAQSPSEAAGNAQATAQYGNVTTMVGAISKMGVAQQHTVYNAQTPSMQQQLKAAGYKPPPDPKEMGKPGRGIFGDIGAGLSSAWHAVTSFEAPSFHAVSSGVGHGINALSKGLGQITHLARAAQYENDQQVSSGQGNWGNPFGTHGVLNIQAWKEGWDASNNAPKDFVPSVLRKIQASADPQQFAIAKKLASGLTEQQIVQGTPAAQQQQVVQQLQDPKMQTLITQLNNAHLSPGRWAVGESFMNDHPVAGKLISGATDAAFDWYADPVNRVGGALAMLRRTAYGIDAQRATSFIVKDGTEADALNHTDWQAYMNRQVQRPTVNRFVQTAGDMLAKGQVTTFKTTFSASIGKVADQLVADGVDSPEKLADWMGSQAGMHAILSGDAARASKGVTLLPHLSPVGWAAVKTRAALRNGLDTLIDNTHDLHDVPVSLHDLVHAAGPLGQPGIRAALGEPLTHPGDLEQLAGRQGLTNAIGSSFRGGVSKVARFTRHLGTYTPSKPFVDLSDPNDFQTLRSALLYSLPVKTVDQIGQLYAHAGIADRFKIAKASIAQMLHYAGAFANSNDSGRIMDMMQESYRNEAYAPLGIDKISDSVRHALLETQTSNRVHIPSLYEVHRASLADNFLQRMGIPEWVPGTKTASTVLRGLTGGGSKLMGIWRPMVLARIGFPLRVAIDENGNYLLRNGALPMIAARAALHSYKGDMKGMVKARDAAIALEKGQDPDVTRWARAASIFTQHVPAPILNAATSMKDIGTAAISENAWRVFKGTTGLSKNDFYKAADAITTRWGVAGPAISALHHAGGGYDEAEHLENFAADGQHVTSLRWVKKGLYSEAGRDDKLFLQKWQSALDTYGSSKLARTAMETAHQSPDTQFRHVLAMLKSDDPDMVKLRASNDRSFRLPDGREVGVDAGVTEDAAHRAWARKIVAATNAMVRGQGGTLHSDLISEVLAKHGAPALDTLKGIDDLPKGVFGPDLVPVTKFNDLLGKGMNKLAGMMDVLSREPNYLHAVARNMKEIEPFVRGIQGEGEHAGQLLGDLAVQRGIRDLKPFIHNPELKTQFEVLHRTAAPFLFAQHQFLQRWGRTFAENPAAIREAQLTMNGLETSGMIHKDAQGNWFFYYPGSGAATSAIAHVLDHFGIKTSLSTDIPFVADVKNLAPGLSNPLTPSAGPFLAIPIKAIAQFDPAFNGDEQALLQQGASQSYWEQVMPSVVSRVVNGIIGDQTPGSTYASSMVNSIAAAEAAGHGLLDIARQNGHVVNGTPVPDAKDEAQYLSNISNNARLRMFATAALGFVAPASPTQQYDTKGLDARYNQLLNELPYNEAINQFLKENPNGGPWTVAKSTTTGEVNQLPASAAAGKWIDANPKFVEDHPYASGWFIPRTTGNEPFDPAVYREQIQYGLRSPKAPKQFLDDVAIAPAASTYYQVYDAKQAAIAADPNNTALKQQVNTRFDQWRGTFLALNPLFASDLQGNTNGARRSNTIQDINAALKDPKLPDSPQATHVANMAEVYNAWEQNYAATQGNTSTTSYKAGKALETRVIAWGTQYAKDNADVSDLWTLVYMPEIRSIVAGVSYPITSAATGG